jgi:hypothetical protein
LEAVKHVVKPFFTAILKGSIVPKKSIVYIFSQAKIGFSSMFTSTLGILLFGAKRVFARGGVPAGFPLPNVERHQLRHTSISRLLSYYNRYSSKSQVFYAKQLQKNPCFFIKKLLIIRQNAITSHALRSYYISSGACGRKFLS